MAVRRRWRKIGPDRQCTTTLSAVTSVRASRIGSGSPASSIIPRPKGISAAVLRKTGVRATSWAGPGGDDKTPRGRSLANRDCQAPSDRHRCCLLRPRQSAPFTSISAQSGLEFETTMVREAAVSTEVTKMQLNLGRPDHMTGCNCAPFGQICTLLRDVASTPPKRWSTKRRGEHGLSERSVL